MQISFLALAGSLMAMVAAQDTNCATYKVVNQAHLDLNLIAPNMSDSGLNWGARMTPDSSVASGIVMCLEDCDGDLYFSIDGPASSQSCTFHFGSPKLNWETGLEVKASTDLKCQVRKNSIVVGL